MIENRELSQVEIFQEFDQPAKDFWFDFSQKKFLHNIDTFYYSVKLHNDFTVKSEDPAVLQFRKKFDTLRDKLGYNDSLTFYVEGAGNLNLLNFSYGKYYNICLECPDYFHIFMASKVPPGASNGESVTSEIIVQIRSYMLWLYGVYEAFRRSFVYVQGLCDMFGLQIALVQENRIDYCYHSNYLANPEKFFAIDNFYKMRVDRYRGANFHTAKRGSEDYEIDYVSLGNRGGKCFVRIYLKSKEVVEQGYKAFFFKLWLFNGLISRYDLYCYEKAYIMRSWQYITIARMEFYQEYGSSELIKDRCKQFIAEYDNSGKVTDQMLRFVDMITPKIHLIVNVEYQTMRKGTKSYQLLPVRDNSAAGVCRRVYDYLDNRPLISRYLTHDIFRLVEPSGDSNKSRRDYCGFWKALRSTKMVDARQLPDDLELVRTYNRNLNKEMMRRSLVNKAVVYGFYEKGLNNDNIMKDCMDALFRLNDNDIYSAMRYKKKKSLKFNANEFQGNDNDIAYRFILLDKDTGAVYDENNTPGTKLQGGFSNDEQ